MDRRDFIKHTGAAAAAVAAVSTGSAAARAETSVAVQSAPYIGSATRELRLGTPWLQNGRGQDDSVRRLAQLISTLSDGRLRIHVDAQPQSLNASATIDLHHTSGRDLIGLDPAFAFFAGLPGSAAMRPTYLNAWLTAGGGQSLWDDLGARHGFKPLLSGHSGARAKLWSRLPLTTAEDFKGKRIAADALSAEIVRGLGAEPVALSPTQQAAALAAGDVDAVEGGGTITGFGHDLHHAAKHCLRPGLSRSGFATVLTVRLEIWNDLRPAEQTVIAAAAMQEFNTIIAENLSLARPLRNALAERHGLVFSPIPADIAKLATAAADRWVADTAVSSPAARQIHMSYKAFRDSLPGVRRKAPAPIA